MRVVLLATLLLAALACSHAAPAPAKAAVARGPDAGVGLVYPIARTVDVVDDISTLQAAQAGPAPVLIRIERRAGHSVGKPTLERIARTCWRSSTGR